MLTKDIQMVDLQTQYQKIKPEVDAAIEQCLSSSRYIGGSQVKAFQENLEAYLGVKHVIPCANGTDALQIAMMALDLQPGDEVIVPTFTYVATAEVIALLRLKPVMVDVKADTFDITAEIVEAAITPKTKAIVPVHLFGQTCDMEGIMAVAEKHGLYVIEDNAQAIGSDYTFKNGHTQKAGTIGHIGCTSFFPSKNLGCFGDGGAMFTNDDELAKKIRMVANHGQSRRYYHDVVGVNSRLDAIQAAVLGVKLKYLDDYIAARQKAAATYDAAFADIEGITTPVRHKNSTHVFHQYTMKVANGKRDELKAHLEAKGIPAMIYYPVPLNEQKAYKDDAVSLDSVPVTNELCACVLSLPMHTELTEEVQNYIIAGVKSFFTF